MENNHTNISSDFRVNQRQKEIIKGLIEQSFSTKNLANMYIGALKVLNDESNPERIYQSAHSLRELVKNMTAHIEVAAETAGKHKEKMKQLISHYDELGGVDKEVIVGQWHDLHQYFVKLCHHGLIAQEEDFMNNLLKLEYILSSLLGPVYETIEELDRLISIENPIRADMEFVKTLLKKQSHYRYFLKNLYHPNWLDLLIENQFFDRPPQAGEYCVEPLYLTKIANEKPTKVVEIIKKLSRTTHEGAQVEFIKALIKVPIKESLKLKNAIKRWISNATSGYPTLSNQVVKYIKKLFKENEIKIAFELVTSILAIREEEILANLQTGMSNDMKNNIESYFYGEIIKELFPELKLYLPLLTLKILSKKLVIVINKELNKRDASIKGDNDHSINWRRLIDEHDYYTYSKDIKNILVNAIRDLLLFIGNEHKTDFNKAIKILRENNYLIFRRIELFVIRFNSELSAQYINEAISNKLYFNELYNVLEFFKLLEDCFSKANNESQQRYFNWVREGPNIEGYKEYYKKNGGNPLSEDDLKSFIHHWNIKKLAPIKKYLSEDIIKELTISIKEVEKVNPLKKFSKVQIGPVSPIKKEELENMTVQEILKYIKSFREPEGSFSFSKIGLGRILRDIIKENPHAFTFISSEFLKSDELHKYISFYLDGFRDGLKNGKKFDWQPLISLSKTILVTDEEKEIAISEAPIFYKENTFRDIKTSVGWLIEDGLTVSENSIPIAFKEDILEILNALNTDKKPTLEEEVNNIKGNWRLLDMAFNTVRGIAMNGVIEYGLWYANNTFDDIILNDPSKPKLHTDVKKILEKHLNNNINPSYTNRYIIGLNLNNLIFLDKKWVLENISNIFPNENDKREYWEVAWAGYLDGNVINQETYNILRENYDRALEFLNDDNENPLNVKLVGYSVERLANDIMRLYINGIEDLKSGNSLVNKFFQRAPDDILKIAIAYIGQNLSKLNEIENFEEVLKRLMELWEDRLSKIKNDGVDNHTRELTYFLFWFKNSIFEKKWTVLRLEEILDLTNGSIGAFSDILDTFLDYVRDFPLNIINCLEKIVKYEVVRSGYLIFQEKYEPILKTLLESENQEAMNKTKDLIDYLGSRDLHYFRDLLN